MSKITSTTASGIVIVAVLLVAWFMQLDYAFPIVMALLVVFCALLGVVICKRPLGILITEQNVMSLARFQTTLWTIIIISAFLVIAIARIKNGVTPDEEGSELADPLKIMLGKDLLVLLGISAASLVGSPLIAATKTSKTPDSKAIDATARQMIRMDKTPDSMKEPTEGADPRSGSRERANESTYTVAAEIRSNADGILYKNPTINDASFADLFEGNEIGNAAHVDLAKVQMFFFTVVIAVAYVVALWDVISTEAIYGPDFAFPALSDGMVALLGISNAGYLAAKGVDHTAKSQS